MPTKVLCGGGDCEMKGQMIKDNYMGREILIYLPPSYKKARIGFPVVYVQDKGDLFQPMYGKALIDLESLFEAGKLAELILVGVETKDRSREYTPWYGRALDEQHSDFGGQGDNYLSFLAQRLKPNIDNKYNTLAGPETTGIAGSSLGGLISLYAAYLYPGVFGRIASISGSFWYEGLMEFMETQQLTDTGRKIYLDVGSREGTNKTNIQKEMVYRARNAYQILRNNGFRDENCKLVIDQDAVHRRWFFSRRFPSALAWLFSK
jgi:predicted alpha/beta superfamily hydrolase